MKIKIITISSIIIIVISMSFSCKSGIDFNSKNIVKETQNELNNNKPSELMNVNKSDEEFSSTQETNNKEEEVQDAINAKDIKNPTIDLKKYKVKHIYDRYKILYNEFDKEYIVCIKDRDGRFHYLKYPKEPYVNIENNKILVIYLSLGSPGPNYQWYYDLDRDLLSPVYICSKALEANLIYFVDDKNCLIIRDIFYKDVFYKEIYRDFYKAFLNPTFAISAIKIKDNKILLEYYKGKERTEIKEQINLN